MDLLKKIFPYALSLILAAWLIQSCFDNRRKEKDFENNIRISRDSTKHFKDAHGQLVSEKETMELTAKDLKKQAYDLRIDQNRLNEQIGKQGKLISYYKGQLIARGHGEVKGVDTTFWDNSVWDGLNDSTQVVAQKFSFDNKFLKFSGLYNPLEDSLHIDYSYKVNFELTNYRTKRKYLIAGPRQTFADVRLSDPNAKMIDTQSILIKEPPKKFYERWWFGAVVGFVGGVYLVSRL